MNPSVKIYRLFVVFLILLGLAVVLPRFVAGGRQDLAAGAAAAVAGLGIGTLASILAVVLLVMTLRAGSSLSTGARVAGLIPLPLAMAAAILLVVLIRNQRDRNRHDSPPTNTVKPTTAPTAP